MVILKYVVVPWNETTKSVKQHFFVKTSDCCSKYQKESVNQKHNFSIFINVCLNERNSILRPTQSFEYYFLTRQDVGANSEFCCTCNYKLACFSFFGSEGRKAGNTHKFLLDHQTFDAQTEKGQKQKKNT